MASRTGRFGVSTQQSVGEVSFWPSASISGRLLATLPNGIIFVTRDEVTKGQMETELARVSLDLPSN